MNAATAWTATGAIFDLDGVLVDTARFHHQAWQRLAGDLGFTLEDALAEQLKGVGRLAALDIVLASGRLQVDIAEADALAETKNRYYLASIEDLTEDALLPGAHSALLTLAELGVPTALASASRNAGAILRSTGLAPLLATVVDGTVVADAKPDPAVFLTAAQRLGLAPEQCVVFEDAAAGVEGALRAGCLVVGIGDPDVLTAAEHVVPSLAHIDWRHHFADTPTREHAR